MAREFKRSQRVGDHIQKELATIIQMPMRDAGLGMVTISAVDLSADLTRAKIFIVYLGAFNSGSDDLENNQRDASNRANALLMLNNNTAQFRHQLSKILTTRTVPKLQFIFDESLEQANRLTSLIDSLHTQDP